MAKAVKEKTAVKKTRTKAIKPEPTLPELNNKEELFCVEYSASDNRVKSFMLVWPNYTYQAAAVEAGRLLKNPLIIQRVAELKEQRKKDLQPTIDKVISELSKLAFYDPRGFFDSDMRLKPLAELNPDQAAVIAGIETFHKVTGEDNDGVCITTKIKLPDKKAALEMLGKNLKMWNDVGSKENPLTVETLPDSELDARLAALESKG